VRRGIDRKRWFGSSVTLFPDLGEVTFVAPYLSPCKIWGIEQTDWDTLQLRS
jgi:hypothetical protein